MSAAGSQGRRKAPAAVPPASLRCPAILPLQATKVAKQIHCWVSVRNDGSSALGFRALKRDEIINWVMYWGMTAVPLRSVAKANMFDSIARSIFPSRKLITLSLAAKGLYLIHCCGPIAGLIGGGLATSPQGRLRLNRRGNRSSGSLKPRASKCLDQFDTNTKLTLHVTTLTYPLFYCIQSATFSITVRPEHSQCVLF
jgi:hypothetical protein